MAREPEAKKAYSELDPWEQMQRELFGIAELTAGDSFEIAKNVINEIAAATSLEAIFSANEGGPGDFADHLGEPVGIANVRYYRSSEQFRNGTLGVYAVGDFVNKDGNEFMLSVGAPNVVASIRQMETLGLFGNGKICWFTVKGRGTPNGTLYTVHAAS